MWTVQPDAAATVIAPSCGGRTLLARAPGSVELLDCEPVSADAEWASGGLTQSPPGISPIAYIDTSGKASAEPPPESRAPHVTYTLTFVSDYLRGGVSRTDGKPALQGAIDVRTHDRWSFGARASNIAKHGNLEIALYGSKTIALGDTDLTLGVTASTFPRDPSGNFVLVQASAARAIGPIDATASIIYAPPQSHLDGEDNLYGTLRARTPIGTILGAPITLTGSIGRMHGHFADAHSRSDWSLGFVARVHGVDVGLTYVDNDLGSARGDPTAVLSLTHSF